MDPEIAAWIGFGVEADKGHGMESGEKTWINNWNTSGWGKIMNAEKGTASNCN